MKKLIIMAMAVGLASCQPEQIEPVQPDEPINDTIVELPVPCVLKLSKDFNPSASMQHVTFNYYDVNGVEHSLYNPPLLEVDSVDFSMPVLITGYAGNNFDPDVLCNWYLKKDGVLIDAQSVIQYTYQN